MTKIIIVSICIACLTLGGCTEDNLLSDPRTPLSTEPVTVKLTLGIDDYNSSSDGKTRMKEMPPVLSISSPDMDVELVATPASTRAALVGITEDNAVYSYMGFQFEGIKPEGKLVEKKFFTSSDGSIRTDDVEIQATSPGQKNMVVIVTNVNESDFEDITVGSSTYADLQNLCMTLATDDGIFPRNTVNLPNGGGQKKGIVMCGQTAAEITKGKQIYVSLKRTVARVAFNIKTTYQHFVEVEHTWNVTLMNIPTQSYYSVTGRKAIFPSESETGDNRHLFWTKSLATVTAANPVIETTPLYIPINLQKAVPTSTQSTRRDNAPSGGTYLQIIGLENKTITGANGLNVVTDFSIYQLFLGKNFTTDYSVSANYDLTYNITLKGNSPDDTNVIRLIPGYFSGELTAYDANGNDLPSVNDASAVKWKYPNRIELYFSDGYYPEGSSSGTTTAGEKSLKWYAGTSFDKLGATSLTDGRHNTALLQASNSPWEDYAAAHTCYRGTNGYGQGEVAEEDILWYFPSVSELIGTWISSSSTQKQLAESYWSSTADPDADNAFVVTNEGEVYSDAVGKTHAVRASQDPDKASHAGN